MVNHGNPDTTATTGSGVRFRQIQRKGLGSSPNFTSPMGFSTASTMNEVLKTVVLQPDHGSHGRVVALPFKMRDLIYPYQFDFQEVRDSIDVWNQVCLKVKNIYIYSIYTDHIPQFQLSLIYGHQTFGKWMMKQ